MNESEDVQAYQHPFPPCIFSLRCFYLLEYQRLGIGVLLVGEDWPIVVLDGETSGEKEGNVVEFSTESMPDTGDSILWTGT